MAIALDPAAADLQERRVRAGARGRTLSAEEMAGYWAEMSERYPIVSIGDGMDEEELGRLEALTEGIGDRVQLVGDDLFVTNLERLKRGIDQSVANSILIKVNQIGTLSETLAAIRMAEAAGYTAVMSRRSGETGHHDRRPGRGNGLRRSRRAPPRSDRVAKYNQLLRIEEALGADADPTARSRSRRSAPRPGPFLGTSPRARGHPGHAGRAQALLQLLVLRAQVAEHLLLVPGGARLLDPLTSRRRIRENDQDEGCEQRHLAPHIPIGFQNAATAFAACAPTPTRASLRAGHHPVLAHYGFSCVSRGRPPA